MRVDIDCHFDFLILGTIEFSQSVNDDRPVLSSYFDLFQERYELLVIPTFFWHFQEEFGEAENGSEQVVEVVGDSAGQESGGFPAA